MEDIMILVVTCPFDGLVFVLTVDTECILVWGTGDPLSVMVAAMSY